MNEHRFSGLGVALVTPFTPSGTIDFPALENIINHCINGGVDYLVSLGTTGEAITLSFKECRQVLDFTIEINNGRVPLVVGMFGHNDTAELVNRIQQFDFTGFAGILSSSPSYNKPTQEGIFQHYMKMADVAPLPIIIYNVPGRTASTIRPETILRLAHADTKFAAVKDATGDLVAAAKIAKAKPDHFDLLSGDDPTCLPLLSVGGSGLISVLGNLLPDFYSQMVHAANAGDYATARAIHHATVNFHDWVYVEGNPVGIKAAMEMAALCGKDVRLPLVPMSDTNRKNMQQAYTVMTKALQVKV